MAHNSGWVCSYFLQGNCRFGDRCWYEHPRGGRASQAFGQNSGPSRRGARGGQQHYSVSLQAFNYSKSSKWKSNNDPRSSNFSQNRFAALDSNEHVNNDTPPEEEKLNEIIMKDMEIWESSGQWMFSSYSPMKEKPNISGFSDFLPEELRLVYYNCKANNNTQVYINSVQQLVNQWKCRLHELKNATPSTKTAMELKNVSSHQYPPFGFGQQQMSPSRTSSFPTDAWNTAQAFSFKSPEPAAGSFTDIQGAALPSAAPPTIGFNNMPDSSASSFSFNMATTSDGVPTFSGFGTPPSANFLPDTTPASGFGKAIAPPAFSSTYTLFGEPAPSLASNIAVTSPAIPTFGSSEELFTSQLRLSTEELRQFKGIKFILGKVPLRPPPMEFLNM
ncbi:PREDICTED: nucleoporin-like protein 2 [Thamnophis sirtalis]|uniref:Nucleoporin NUP42 n=1 Tax=Thamnophis sirtalis TaxID=35019 RepID=A0A6I9X9S0_9SAUR|nr:PREDICTED: nucleoporin-like protein 2 [Thamnophis sirtalis]